MSLQVLTALRASGRGDDAARAQALLQQLSGSSAEAVAASGGSGDRRKSASRALPHPAALLSLLLQLQVCGCVEESSSTCLRRS